MSSILHRLLYYAKSKQTTNGIGDTTDIPWERSEAHSEWRSIRWNRDCLPTFRRVYGKYLSGILNMYARDRVTIFQRTLLPRNYSSNCGRNEIEWFIKKRIPHFFFLEIQKRQFIQTQKNLLGSFLEILLNIPFRSGL